MQEIKKDDNETKPIRCKQEDCNLPAVARMFWPGSSPIPCCQRHVYVMRMLNDAIGGGYLYVEALPGFVEIILPAVNAEAGKKE